MIDGLRAELLKAIVKGAQKVRHDGRARYLWGVRWLLAPAPLGYCPVCQIRLTSPLDRETITVRCPEEIAAAVGVALNW